MEMYNEIDLNDNYGMCTFLTPNNNKIYTLFNRNNTLLHQLVDKFHNNFSCFGYKEPHFDFLSNDLKRNLCQPDMKKQINQFNLPQKFTLIVKICHCDDKKTYAKFDDETDQEYETRLINILEKNYIDDLNAEIKCNIEMTLHEKQQDKILAKKRQNIKPWIGQIFLKTFTGKTLTFSVTSNTTVLELKEQIQTRDGIPPDQCRLIYAGIQLVDEKTLIHYGMEKESMIHMVLRLRGGMYHETSGKDGNYKPLSTLMLYVNCSPDEFIKKN